MQAFLVGTKSFLPVSNKTQRLSILECNDIWLWKEWVEYQSAFYVFNQMQEEKVLPDSATLVSIGAFWLHR